MPIVKLRYKEERFRVETPEEEKIIEKAKDNFCRRGQNHDNYDFVRKFFHVRSRNPTTYIGQIKRGGATISLKAWNNLCDYVSKSQSE